MKINFIFRDDTLRSLKKTSYFMNKNPSGGNFASRVLWHTIVFKVSAFYFFGQILADMTIWSKILSSILITIVVEATWFP